MALKSALVLAIGLLGVQAFADIDLKQFYPATICSGVPTKASLISNVTVKPQGDVYAVEFNLALLECQDGATQFSTYTPQAGEYLEVFQIDPPTYQTQDIAIPSYLPNAAYTHVALTVSRDPARQQGVYRLDIFLTGTHIPYQLSIQE